MELLIIKSGEDYIRVKETQYRIVGLEKASVFPFEQMEQVRRHEKRIKALGFKMVSIKKLILTEEDLNT